MSTAFTVDLATAHSNYAVPKWVCNLMATIHFATHLTVGIWLARLIYFNMLFAEKLNPIPCAFFCLLSLGCLMQCGLPIEKMANVMKS